MKQSFILLLSFFLLGCNFLTPQEKAKTQESVFGKIRADMVRAAAKQLGVPDSIIVTIDEISLKNFKQNIKNNHNYTVLEKAPILESSNTLDTIVSKLLQFNNLLGDSIKNYERDDFERKINTQKDSMERILAQKKSQNKHKLNNSSPIEENSANEADFQQLLLENQRLTKIIDSLSFVINTLEQERTPTQTTSAKATTNNITIFKLFLSILLVALLFVFIYFKYGKKRNRKEKRKKSRIKNPGIKSVSSKIDTKSNTSKTKTLNAKTPASEENNQQVANFTESSQPPVASPVPLIPPAISENDNAFAKDADEWIVVGASVTGNGHLANDISCQDSHKYEYLGDGWGIAIVSDGAGSAVQSERGSKLVSIRGMELFKKLIDYKRWKKDKNIPSDDEWRESAYLVLKQLRDDMEALSKKLNIPVKSLSATAIVLIHTPEAILVTHVGDGRAGYKNEQGEWLPLITPHKGEEANQTIFLPSEFWDIPFFKMSGVYAPESIVIRQKPFGFVLMSDGCEATSWQYYTKDVNSERYYDPNVPHAGFFKPLDATLQSFRTDNVNLAERSQKWWNFIHSGTPSFIKETDDKTMILGVIYL